MCTKKLISALSVSLLVMSASHANSKELADSPVADSKKDPSSMSRKYERSFMSDFAREFDDYFAQMERLHEQLCIDQECLFDNAFSRGTSSQEYDFNVSEQDDFVVLTFKVPAINAQGVTVEVHGDDHKTLVGSVPLEQGTIDFEVSEYAVQVLQKTSIEHKLNDPKDQSAQSVSYSSSTSSFVESLPAQVARLDDATIDVADNVLTVKLPKAKKAVPKKLSVNIKK
jgi:HSP20 family molecular chaperone IbpA